MIKLNKRSTFNHGLGSTESPSKVHVMKYKQSATTYLGNIYSIMTVFVSITQCWTLVYTTTYLFGNPST